MESVAPATLAGLADKIQACGQNYEVDQIGELAETFCKQLAQVNGQVPIDCLRTAMKGLAACRQFALLAKVAELAGRRGLYAPFVRNFHGQALIELGQVLAAIEVLKASAAASSPDHDDHLEAQGLLGRAYKQLYIDEKRTPRAEVAGERLRQSIRSYARGYLATYDNQRQAYDPVRASWHMVQLAALIERAKADNVALDTTIQSGPVAREVLGALLPLEASQDASPDAWRSASIAAAYLALGDNANARKWYGFYSAHDDLDAFKLFGTIRQLEEVWGIAEGDEARGQLLLALKTRMLDMTGSHAVFDARRLNALSDIASHIPEAILGDEIPIRIAWLRRGLQCARSVARVRRIRRNADLGTGFLVRGGDFAPSLGDELFLLTNNHVIGNPPSHPGVRPEEVYVGFDEDGGEPGADAHFACTEVVWQSVWDELDASLVRLERQPELPHMHLADDDCLPEAYRGDFDTRDAYIIGHPAGEELSISMHDTDVIDIGYRRQESQEHEYLHYRTPTRPGSSGSPVFEHDNWHVIGLHHAGPPGQGGSRRLGGKNGFNPPANEGITIRSIRRAVAQDLG